MTDLKAFKIDFLPNSNDFWVILSWGRVVNDGSGNYKVQVIFNRLKNVVHGDQTADFKVARDQVSVIVNLEILRALTPGTIVSGQKIVSFVHEYRTGVKSIDVARGQEFTIAKFGDFVVDIPGMHFGESWKKVPVLEFETARGQRTIIPCSVIADYYFFGRPKLIKSILEGKIHRTVKSKNKVYDPSLVQISPSSNGKILAYIRLERDMFDEDGFKIARLAHDEYLWNSCIELNANLIKKRTEDSYMQCSFPVTGGCTLNAYGRKMDTPHGEIYYVYKIMKCSSRPPFDALIISRDNPGGSGPTGYLNNNDGKNDENVNSNNGDKTVTKLDFKPYDKSKTKTISQSNADFRGLDGNISFSNPEVNSLTSDMIVKEEALLGFGRGNLNASLSNFISVIGDLGYTTEEEKKGKNNTIRLRLSSYSPANTINPIPTTCFELIENSIMFAECELRIDPTIKNLNGLIRGVVPFGESKYSIFPVYDIKGNDSQSKRQKQFCFIEVKKNRYKLFRHVFIYELMVDGIYFYILDVEPKYKRKVKTDDEKIKETFNSGLAVIINTDTILSNTSLISLLKELMISGSQLKPVARNEQQKKQIDPPMPKQNLWTFLTEMKYTNTKTFKHTTAEKMRSVILNYIRDFL